MKENKPLSILKKASAALARGLKLLAIFFTSLSSRLAGWTTVGQRGDLVQQAREAQEARIKEEDARRAREADEARIKEEDARRAREAEAARIRAEAARLAREAKALSYADVARLAREAELRRRQCDRGHDGPNIGM